jgi:hypothetical protein
MINSNGNLETRVAALETQMQEVRELLQQTIVIVNRTAQVAESAIQIANSNARSIQAWEALIEENRVEAEEERSQMQVLIRELIDANAQNRIEHELFRRRFEAIDPLVDEE